jgi:hypothetical protein
MEETDFLRQHKLALDRTIAEVMPSHWVGHARIIIRESEAVPEESENQAFKSVEAAIDARDVTAEEAATAFIETASE